MQPMTPLHAAPAVPLVPTKRTGKYLIFRLGVEEFGIQVLQVQEIMGLQHITAIPQVPDYVKGVINLRGKVVPVIDLRLKFRMKPEEYSARTCIVVMRIREIGEETIIGMVVDSVVEVLNLTDCDIEDAPDFGPGVVTSYLAGIAKVKGRVKILLDIDPVLRSDELQSLTALTAVTNV